MKEKGKISVIIPVYNTEKYLDKCLSCVINQTYDNIEIIVINDGSIDNSLEIIKKYQEIDSRIVVVSRENKGLLNTRIEGISMATGEYIIFIDSDDWIDLEAIENMYNFASEMKVDVVRCNKVKELIAENRKIYMDKFIKTNQKIEKNEFREYVYPLILNTYTCNSIVAQLIKKKCIENLKLDETIILGEDLSCNLELYSKINSIVFLQEYYYHYYYNTNSLTTAISIESINKKINDVKHVYSSLFEYLKIWNINNTQNQKVVLKRVLNEMINCSLQLLKMKNINKKIVASFLEENFNQFNYNKKILLQSDIEKQSKLFKYVYNQEYNKATNLLMGSMYYKFRFKTIIKSFIYKR